MTQQIFEGPPTAVVEICAGPVELVDVVAVDTESLVLLAGTGGPS